MCLGESTVGNALSVHNYDEYMLVTHTCYFIKCKHIRITLTLYIQHQYLVSHATCNFSKTKYPPENQLHPGEHGLLLLLK